MRSSSALSYRGSRLGRRVYGAGITGNRVQVKGTWLRLRVQGAKMKE